MIFRWHYFYFLVACLDFVMIFLYIFLFLENTFVAVDLLLLSLTDCICNLYMEVVVYFFSIEIDLTIL